MFTFSSSHFHKNIMVLKMSSYDDLVIRQFSQAVFVDTKDETFRRITQNMTAVSAVIVYISRIVFVI